MDWNPEGSQIVMEPRSIVQHSDLWLDTSLNQCRHESDGRSFGPTGDKTVQHEKDLRGSRRCHVTGGHRRAAIHGMIAVARRTT